jgi:hypothetical protein
MLGDLAAIARSSITPRSQSKVALTSRLGSRVRRSSNCSGFNPASHHPPVLCRVICSS